MVKSRIKRAPAASKPARKAIPSPLEEWKKAARAANAGKHEAELARIYDEQRIYYRRHVQLIPGRKLEWDFVVDSFKLPLQPMIAIEVQGGAWIKGGHTSGTGLNRDCEKICLATCAGYRVLNFTAAQIEDGRALLWTLEALGIE